MHFDIPVLITDRLILRLAMQKDAQAVLNYYLKNEEFLTSFEPARPDGFYTLVFWQEQIEKAIYEFHYDQSLKLCIFKKTDPSNVIGKINFSQIQHGIAHSCLLGYGLSEVEQGNGYMFEALTDAIRFVFEGLNLHRIMANYMPRNQRSGNLLKRLDFFVEGYARDYLLINGKWEDHILTSLLNPNWQEKVENPGE
jgi:ribosomal-protein-alanine N-acetyltransferase